MRLDDLPCGKDEFRCIGENHGGPFYSGRIRDRYAQCIPQTWVCDGEADCRDGSDENQHCDSKAFSFLWVFSVILFIYFCFVECCF